MELNRLLYERSSKSLIQISPGGKLHRNSQNEPKRNTKTENSKKIKIKNSKTDERDIKEHNGAQSFSLISKLLLRPRLCGKHRANAAVTRRERETNKESFETNTKNHLIKTDRWIITQVTENGQTCTQAQSCRAPNRRAHRKLPRPNEPPDKPQLQSVGCHGPNELQLPQQSSGRGRTRRIMFYRGRSSSLWDWSPSSSHQGNLVPEQQQPQPRQKRRRRS